MKTNYEIRYAAHPEDAKHYDTARLRRDFLMETIFVPDEVNMVYSMYDRMIVGGAMPVAEALRLEAIDPLKAEYFTQRRELGIYNVGGAGTVKVGEESFELDFKEALYIGRGDRDVVFSSKDPQKPAKFYFNSATAHKEYPCKKVTKEDAVVAHMGSLEMSNERNINKMIVNQVLPTCQLQMGMTELATGSVWNTMPAHVHSRRMEAYFYFELPEDVWRLTFTLNCQRTRLSVTLWANRKRHATSGCTASRPYSHRNGVSIVQQLPTTTPSSGVWAVRISTMAIRTFIKSQI